MDFRSSGTGSAFRHARDSATKVGPGPRRGRAIETLFLTVLALGIACFATGSLPRAFAGTTTSGTPTRPLAAAAPTITTFDAPGAGTTALEGTFGTSINAEGDIAGIYLTSPNVAHGFVRSGATGTITVFNAADAGTAMNQGTFPISINASGDTTGMYFDSSNAYHGFVRSGATGAITEFDVTGAPTNVGHRGTLPLTINASGDITGIYVDAGAVRHGFVRSIANGTASFTTFNVTGAGTNSRQGTDPISINAAGEVTGFYVDSGGLFHGFVRAAGGTVTSPIDAPNAGTAAGGNGFSFIGTLPLGVDTAGDIAGAYSDNNGVHHGFVYTFSAATPALTAFDVTGAGTTGLFPGTIPSSMNASGDIAGFYEDSNGVNHGFSRLGSTGAITAPLDAPGASTSGMFSGTLPLSINSTGVIAGVYADANEVFHGFIVTPPAAAAPAFSPVAGTYTAVQPVTISDATPGALIFYTTDGSTPTTASTQYNGAISVGASETINAIATASGFSASAVASAAYVINLPTPDFQVSVNPTSLTIVAGQSGQAVFTVTPENGFNSPVSFACSGLPSEATCSFAPASVTPNGAAVTSTLTLSTTAASAAAYRPATIQLPIYGLLFASIAMLFSFFVRQRRAIPLLRALAFCALVFVVSGLASCSKGKGSGGSPGTPAGTSMVSVSVSTGMGGMSHGASLTITITN